MERKREYNGMKWMLQRNKQLIYNPNMKFHLENDFCYDQNHILFFFSLLILNNFAFRA